MTHIGEDHGHNFLILHGEDFARRRHIRAPRFRGTNRKIHLRNQPGNDATETMDAALVASLLPPGPDALAHSESPGMMPSRGFDSGAAGISSGRTL